MENMINLGIDLGTTNSAIAKFIKGEVIIYSNPTDYGRNTLPSVVGFKKDKIFVGSQAKALMEKDPKNVIGIFKRKMGTSESFKIKAINESKTPIQLSAMVLKELKTFLPPNENIASVVITIPASFDMTQSNATKEAGFQAGFKQVLLLQEPIAACMAYANMKKQKEIKDGHWLVYDLGGGTFDAALVSTKDGEMRIIDHEGDNFLGGTDFDSLIVEKILIPKISEKYSFRNLSEDMKSASGKFNAAYYVLLRRAEEAKILLSAKSSAEILIDGIKDDNDEEVDDEITITRSEFNELIKESIDSTIDLVKKILTRNSLTQNEFQFTLMVGGSTYIPYVRQRVEEVLQIPVNCEIDPTTAVAVGAAYYASTKAQQLDLDEKPKKQTRISIKASYQKISREKEELFSAKITGNIDGLTYRITRNDGGFDTGNKKLTERISEDLPLLENSYNFFNFTVYDTMNNLVETDLNMIGIHNGFGISGQPIPHDICLEVDNENNDGETCLMLIFQKNLILPLKRKITRVLNKTITKGSKGDVIRINVLEGPETSLPEANQLLGQLLINGENISRDILKGSDIELSFTMSESRDLSVSAYLSMADQEFNVTFNPQLRNTPVNVLKMDIENLADKLEVEISEAALTENYEASGELNKLRKEVDSVIENIDTLSEDDVTDKRYQLEDKKRKIAQAIDNATKGKKIAAAKTDYFEQKDLCSKILFENGNDHEHKRFKEIVALEQTFLSSTIPQKIEEKTDELRTIYFAILWRTPEFLLSIFRDLLQQIPKMSDRTHAESFFVAGKFAIESENWSRLAEIISALVNLLPKSAQSEISTKIGF